MPTGKEPPQASLPVVEEPFLARNLFSYHFLKERLPREDPRWRRDEARNSETFQKIKDLYRRVGPAKKEQYQRNEANLEKDFIRPILDVLGHSYDVQESIHFTYRGTERPDYTLFPSEEVRQAAEGDSKRYLTAVIALAEAKAWDLELDKTAKVGPARYANPSLQINNYLRDANITWGILTNGRKWRLYNKETSLHLDSYYEVDLVQLIERGSADDFKYFYLFFRREAFVREALVPSFLDDIFTGSIRYAKELEEDVKENIYDALRLLIKGFLDHPDNRLEGTDLERIHENSLILLYRLLFVLYAEAKGLLPFKNPLYRDMSLERLREDAKRELDKPVPTLTVAGDSFWARLSVLFRLINEGSEARNILREHLFIPPYNGGLFDPAKHPFLETTKVGDKYLAQALHLLSWSGGKNGRQAGFIDYTTLSIRHLGSIYEGLLEYKPMIAEDNLIVVKEKGREVFQKESEVRLTAKQSRNLGRVSSGDIYLQTDKGERKATGSYYTPDYVVKYIVENTLGPLVDEMKQRGLKGMDVVHEILSLKVLDSAMGSGHFLVEATSFLAAKIVEALAEVGERDETAADADVLWARREVARRCIYGVDLNPLAVELAKVSLWLHTVTKDKPLSFLDHHLKCGNSLVGAVIEDLGWLPTERPPGMRGTLEAPLGLIQKILERLTELQTVSENTIDDVKRKEKLLRDLMESDEYQRIKVMADVHTGLFYTDQDHDEIRNAYMELVNEAYFGEIAKWDRKFYVSWVQAAHLEAAKRRFFHWQLEFPEVFFERGATKSEPGFDAVIGNPPYLQKESFDEWEKSVVLYAHPDSASNLNLATLFMAQAMKLTRQRGFHAFIVPKSLLFAKVWRGDRNRLLDGLLRICDVSKAWREVLLEQTIYVWHKGTEAVPDLTADICSDEEIRPGSRFPKELCRFLDAIPVEMDGRLEAILRKCFSSGTNLSSIAELPTGLPYQKDLVQHGGLPAIGGDSIWRFQILGAKGFFPAAVLREHQDFVERTKSPHVVIQRLVAHVTSPTPHIKVAAAINADRFVPVNTLTCVFPRMNNSLWIGAICGWMNSRFYSWYAYNFVFSKAIRSMDMYEYYACKVPLPPGIGDSGSSQGYHFEKMIDDLFPTGQEDPVRIFDNIVKAHNASREKLWELLSYLARRLTELYRERRRLTQMFIDWLESPLGMSARLADLKNKTKVLAFYEDPHFGSEEASRRLEAILSRGETRGDPRKLAIFREEYTKTTESMIPIIERIREAEVLLDRVVYKLYDLAPEEVATIEGGRVEDER